MCHVVSSKIDGIQRETKKAQSAKNAMFVK